MEKILYIDTQEDCGGLVCFLTLCSKMNWISCTDPKRFAVEVDSERLIEYKKKNNWEKSKLRFQAVSLENVEKCIETMFIGGTLCRDKDVIKSTDENLKMLGIKIKKRSELIEYINKFK
jgi:hypothetical protein